MKIQIKRLNGEIIFEHEQEDNTIAKTLVEALENGIKDFRYADFRSADFSSANFRYADFSSANFRSADFSYADFSSANFSYANFSYANFRSADFSSAAGVLYAQISFTGHGEMGRQLLVIKIQAETKLFCGCFSGSESDLREYIKNGEERYKDSRTIALDTVLILLKVEKR